MPRAMKNNRTSKGGAGAQNLQSNFAIDGEDGEAAPGCSPERGVAQTFDEAMGMEEINREEDQESHETCSGPYGEGGAAADGREVEQKGECDGDDDDGGELRSYGDGQGDAEQHDAAPIPENYFARGVERMGHGDGGKDGAERSPGREDFRLGVPDGRGLKDGGRKTVESEGEKSAGIAAETAGNIPERRSEEDSEGEERKARKPGPVGFGRGKGMRPREQGRGGYKRQQRGVLGVEIIG